MLRDTKISHLPPSGYFLGISLVCGLFAAIIFTGWPELDLYVSKQFFIDQKGFIFNSSSIAPIVRYGFVYSFIAFAGLSLAALIATRIKHRAVLFLSSKQWLYLVLCLIIGPGLVTNVIFKDQWGRARPIKIIEFGANKEFTPALIPSSACKQNCSFVSGESSSIFMIFFSLSLLLPTYRRRLLLAGLFLGSVSGIVRIGMGGHFFSDVVFSGIFMMITAYILYQLLFSSQLRTRLTQTLS